MYRCESWSIKEAKHRRIDAFKLWCWRRLLRVSWTAGRSNLSIIKKTTLNIHWKDCWRSWSSNTLATWCKNLTHWKRRWCWERLRAGGWDGWMHHQLNGPEFEYTPGDGEGHGSLVCCSPWGCKESDMTEHSAITAAACKLCCWEASNKTTNRAGT